MLTMLKIAEVIGSTLGAHLPKTENEPIEERETWMDKLAMWFVYGICILPWVLFTILMIMLAWKLPDLLLR